MGTGGYTHVLRNKQVGRLDRQRRSDDIWDFLLCFLLLGWRFDVFQQPFLDIGLVGDDRSIGWNETGLNVL